VPRLAQGAFLAAWEAVYEKCYGGTEIGKRGREEGREEEGWREDTCMLLLFFLSDFSSLLPSFPPVLEITRFGKPWESSYRYAEKMLVHEARLLGLTGKDPPPHVAHPHKDFPIRRVYAIGDNPLSDVEGEGRGGD